MANPIARAQYSEKVGRAMHKTLHVGVEDFTEL